MKKDNILVWLPSPMGDAVLCTPALRALRKCFKSSCIFLIANKTVQELLTPNNFCDGWIEYSGRDVSGLAMKLRRSGFSKAILFKNSFGCALTIFLAGIKERIGYARDGRSVFLTDKPQPLKNPDGSFKPGPMVDYYLALAKRLGCKSGDRELELWGDDGDFDSLSAMLPAAFSPGRPLVILVPGGAFGLSKCWPAERFAETADQLVEKYNAAVVVSVAPNETEERIAKEICTLAKKKLYSLADTPLSPGELKALFAEADLVIANDTGPRHIAIALSRKLITLFGPNDPAWTQTGYKDEVQIIGRAKCAPCENPKCTQAEHECMKSISVKAVFDAASNFLNDRWGRGGK